ncbi:2-hydroxychromene-2-carboxylate isomerase [Phreatobacter cathodiphilus]|uniref:2-hydroxychromene-2-carboxylate isomerase n=1 Tax=Phreatobacter cathodiphilus TaxID=1868589 RepID=A0A2S0NBG2_9HYPH|nr:2-hydroxychromene-2-carboxylate isomerase [Phreatobacter cathodiphilus]AVO45357.1 disulfide bond formation protein DsbA [Phreatobacter cathodiphilus]
MAAVEFFYEFASTYSYPAAMRVEEVAAKAGVTVRWRPFLLGPIFAEAGWTTSPFNLIPAKGRNMWRDLERITADLGLPFQKPDPFPQNSLTAARIATSLPDDGKRAAFSRELYRMEFGEGLSITDAEVLGRALTAAGVEPATALVAAGSDQVKQALRATTEEAKAKGLFGAPSLVTADGELFWGNDRIEQAVAWAAKGGSA